jgi:hypothetical protein
VKKNRLEFFKNRPVWFYKPKTEKTKLNPNRKKPESNRKKPSQTEKTDPNLKNQFEPVFVIK